MNGEAALLAIQIPLARSVVSKSVPALQVMMGFRPLWLIESESAGIVNAVVVSPLNVAPQPVVPDR